MKSPTQDEFSELSVSRQRKWQLRNRRDGRCAECGEPAAAPGHSLCLKHWVKLRERQRRHARCRRRYFGAASYKIAAVGKSK